MRSEQRAATGLAQGEREACALRGERSHGQVLALGEETVTALFRAALRVCCEGGGWREDARARSVRECGAHVPGRVDGLHGVRARGMDRRVFREQMTINGLWCD